jgi:hypothetical protein
MRPRSHRAGGYSALERSEKTCFYILRRFYELGIKTVPFELVKQLAEAEGIANPAECVDKLGKAGLVAANSDANTVKIARECDAQTLGRGADDTFLGVSVSDDQIAALLLSDERYYTLAIKAARVLLGKSGGAGIRGRIFAVTLRTIPSDQANEYTAGAEHFARNGELERAVALLKDGQERNTRGGIAISTRLSAYQLRQGEMRAAIDTLRGNYTGEKLSLTYLTSYVLRDYGAFAALRALNDNVGLLNGKNDGMIKESVGAASDGDYALSREKLLEWLEAYKAELDAQISKPAAEGRPELNSPQKKTWSKRAGLAAVILRVYIQTFPDADMLCGAARFLLEVFLGRFDEKAEAYSVWTELARRYENDDRNTFDPERRALNAARKWLEELIGLDPDQRPAVYNTLCYVCCKLRSYEGACAYGYEAVSRGGQYYQNWRNYAVALYGLSRQRDEAEARRLAEKSREMADKFLELLRGKPERVQTDEYERYLRLAEKGFLPQIAPGGA